MRNFVKIETLETSGFVFIIPNEPVYIGDLLKCCREHERKMMEAICNANGITFDPENDLVLNVWYGSTTRSDGPKSWNNDNFGDHTIALNYQGENIYLDFPNYTRIPAKMFAGHKEGDIITIKLPAKYNTNLGPCRPAINETSKDTVVTLHLKLAQKPYRYGHHGNFEDCMSSLIDYKKSIGQYHG